MNADRPNSFKPRLSMERVSDEEVARVLYYLRAEIIREDRFGKVHVEELMYMRGLDPEAFIVPGPGQRAMCELGSRQRSILEALEWGPATLREICQRVAVMDPAIVEEAIYQKTATCLTRLKGRGLVAHVGRIWGLSKDGKI